MRSFIAIAVPESVLKSCQDIMVQLRNLNLQGRFAKTQSIHLTLQFLGNVEEEQIPGITEILEQAGKGVTPFDLEVGRLGVFRTSLIRGWSGLALNPSTHSRHCRARSNKALSLWVFQGKSRFSPSPDSVEVEVEKEFTPAGPIY